MLKICSRFFSGLRSSLLHPDLDIYAGIDLSVTDDTQVLVCKQRVGDAISVKSLVQLSPGLPDLLHRPCSYKHLYTFSCAVFVQPGACEGRFGSAVVTS